jgi:2-aminoethylphosphonate-pyruvate transaminase
MQKRVVLLNPGPVNVTKRVESALLRGDLCHREKECTDLIASIRENLIKVFGIERDYTSALVSGSGTAALEMAVSTSVSSNRKALVINNGVYGERIAKIAQCYGLETKVLEYAWGDLPKLDEIDHALKNDPRIEVVMVVHHETTTGLLNPLGAIAEIVHRHERVLLVDCISSLGGDEIDFNLWQPEICVGTANKCVQGFPGVSFVLIRKDDVQRIEKISPRSLYFDLAAHIKAQDKGDTLFTPAIQVHYALDEALEELKEETVDGRVSRYGKAAGFLRQGFQNLDLEFLLPLENYSNTLTSLKLPNGVAYTKLHDDLKERGFVIYAGQGSLSKTIFRIANIGDIRQEEFQRLLVELGNCLSIQTK